MARRRASRSRSGSALRAAVISGSREITGAEVAGRSWAANLPNFNYVPVISDGLPEDAWTGRTGFVHQAVMADFADLSGHQVYACGAPVMVDAAQRDFVAQCRLPEDAFFADSFTSEADLATA